MSSHRASLEKDGAPIDHHGDSGQDWKPMMTGRGSTTSFLFVTDIRMMETEDRVILAEHPTGASSIWRPFVDAAGSVTLLARQSWGSADVIASGPGVGLVNVPDFSSLLGAARALPSTWGTILRESRGKIMVLRLPEPLSLLSGLTGILTRRPMVSMLVSDPRALRNAFGSLTVPVDYLVRWIVKRSVAVSYQADNDFLRRYPADPAARTIIRSNVDIPPAAVSVPRNRPRPGRPVHFITVASNKSLQKGQEVILHALARLAPHRSLSMTFVGGGNLIAHLERLAGELGLGDVVDFAGHVSMREELFSLLDEADVFLLPSFAEGLPRSIIEAQARGLPVVASDVGSIPSQVPKRQVIPEITTEALASTIADLLDTADEYAHASSGGIEAARRAIERADPERFTQFLAAVLSDRRKGSR